MIWFPSHLASASFIHLENDFAKLRLGSSLIAANYSGHIRRLQLISFSKFLVHNDVRWDDGRKSILIAWVDGHAATKC